MLSSHRDFVYGLFSELKPHKGVFVGVCLLEGCFLCDSPGELYSELAFGERLALADKSKPLKNLPLEVIRADGTHLGNLPFADSILPNLMFARGINVYCYLEAKEFNGGMLAIAVSVYCDEY